MRGITAVLDAVRIVWASLWSDAALLYRRELALDPARSRMAVLVQKLVVADRSGVAFARDPRSPGRDVMVIEAVPGLCRDLVDGAVDPDRWLLRRDSGEVVEIRLGTERGGRPASPLLDGRDLPRCADRCRLEQELGWSPDVEWTGRRRDLVRPAGAAHHAARAPASAEAEDKRPWYLSLRPEDGRLRRLCRRVTEDLIPALERDGERLAAALSEIRRPRSGHAVRERDELLRHGAVSTGATSSPSLTASGA